MKKFIITSLILLCFGNVAFAANETQEKEIAKSVDWGKIKVEAVNESISFLKSTKEFVKEQVPALIQEILTWNKYKLITYLSFSVLCVIVLLIIAIKISRINSVRNSLDAICATWAAFVFISLPIVLPKRFEKAYEFIRRMNRSNIIISTFLNYFHFLKRNSYDILRII